MQFSYAASSNSLEYQKYCFMSIRKNMIINFLIPVFVLIVLNTSLGTICLKHIKAKNRDILCESVEGSNTIANGIILNNGQNIDKFITDKEILSSYYLKTSTFSNQLKCCEEQVNYSLILFSILASTLISSNSTRKIILSLKPISTIPSLTWASYHSPIFRIHLQTTAQTTTIQTSKMRHYSLCSSNLFSQCAGE